MEEGKLKEALNEQQIARFDARFREEEDSIYEPSSERPASALPKDYSKRIQSKDKINSLDTNDLEDLVELSDRNEEGFDVNSQYKAQSRENLLEEDVQVKRHSSNFNKVRTNGSQQEEKPERAEFKHKKLDRKRDDSMQLESQDSKGSTISQRLPSDQYEKIVVEVNRPTSPEIIREEAREEDEIGSGHLDIETDIMKKIMARENGTIMEANPEEEQSMAHLTDITGPLEYTRVDSDLRFRSTNFNKLNHRKMTNLTDDLQSDLSQNFSSNNNPEEEKSEDSPMIQNKRTFGNEVENKKNETILTSISQMPENSEEESLCHKAKSRVHDSKSTNLQSKVESVRHSSERKKSEPTTTCICRCAVF